MTRNSVLRKLVAAAGCAAFIGAVDVGVGRAASANANVTATVVTPIAIAKVSDLAFGTFAVGAGGSLTVTPFDPPHAVGVTLVTSARSVAQFTVSGQPGADYTLTLPAEVILSSGVNNMTVNNLHGLKADLTGGADALAIGGTAVVPVGQPVGVYSGTLTVAVEYD